MNKTMRAVFLVAIGSLTMAASALGQANLLLDIDYQGTQNGKVGYAAIGQSAQDFWNYFTRDDPNAPDGVKHTGSMVNLKAADGTVTAIGLTVTNCPGAWGNSSSDPMYQSYIYGFSSDLTITVTNLPDGTYEVLPYSLGASFDLSSGGVSYGTKNSYDPSASGAPVWTEGVQYVHYTNVVVTGGAPLLLTVHPVNGYSVIAGMQIAQSVPPPDPATVFTSIRFSPPGGGGIALAGLGSSNTNLSKVSLSFKGVPGRVYTVQRANSPAGPWVAVRKITLDLSGAGTLDDTNPPPTKAFYRTFFTR